MYTYEMKKIIKVNGNIVEDSITKITDRTHKLITCTDTLIYFRNLGGQEYIKANKLTSISPNGDTIIIRIFTPLERGKLETKEKKYIKCNAN